MAGVFAHCLDQAFAFRDLLAGPGVERGLIGPRETERLWERHLANCAVATEGLPEHASVADIGSGAGLPGIVWAMVRPDLRITLVEPLARRVSFLQEAVEELELDGIEVVRGRAEQLHGSATFDVVASRAVAPLGRLGGWCLPLVGPGGLMVALKGRSAEAEVERDGPVLHRLGARSISVEEYGADWLGTPTRAVVVRKG